MIVASGKYVTTVLRVDDHIVKKIKQYQIFLISGNGHLTIS